MADGLKYDALAQALKALPGEVQPTRAMRQQVGDKLAALVRTAIVADLGKSSMSGWPAKGEPEGLAILLRSRGRGVNPTVPSDGIMVVRERKGAGMIRVLDRGRNMGDAGSMSSRRHGRASATFLGPGVNRDTGMTLRTKSGNVRKVRASQGKRWNGYTAAERTWQDALKMMQAAAPGAVNEVMAADLADRVRKVVLGG